MQSTIKIGYCRYSHVENKIVFATKIRVIDTRCLLGYTNKKPIYTSNHCENPLLQFDWQLRL